MESRRNKKYVIAAVVFAVFIALMFWSVPLSITFGLTAAAVYFVLGFRQSIR